MLELYRFYYFTTTSCVIPEVVVGVYGVPSQHDCMMTPLRGGKGIGSDFTRIFSPKVKSSQFLFSQAFVLKLPLTQKFQVKNCVVYIFAQYPPQLLETNN